MTNRLGIAFLVFCLCSCRSQEPADPDAGRTGAEGSATLPAQADTLAGIRADLVDRIWLSEDAELPGVIRIFLSNGTLLMDSCWETWRVARWELADSVIQWREDTAEITARIRAIGEDRLDLRLDLSGGTVDQSWIPATVPWVCPDLPR